MSTDDLRAALTRHLSGLDGVRGTLTDLARLTGGASRETWLLTVTDDAGAERDLILRRDPPGAEDPARMAREATVLREAHTAGVPVPELLDHSDGHRVEGLGAAYLLMEKVPGEALPQRLLRDDRYSAVRKNLSYALGRALARIHRIPIDALPDFPAGDQLDELFARYVETGPPLPSLELAFRWLHDHRSPSTRTTVVHGDFRNGNVLVDESGIRAVLDWELTHLGDPMEDLGWLCVKTWRFGAAEPVGGFGSRDELFRGYEDESGIAPDPEAVRWWELYGTLRWAVMCRIQANRALVHGEGNALELLAIGRRISECEHDLLQLLEPDEDIDPATITFVDEPRQDLFGMPSVAELSRAVKAFVVEHPATDAPTRYQARVASKVLDIVAREAEHGARLRAQHRAALDAVGVVDETELALALREGKRTMSEPSVEEAVRQAVAARLVIANPEYAA
ncbi:phosphotransferase family protein [Rhodococcus rhodochrous]|uniref:phosphotransferase family protein n=1 Tax=Rhodococcus rhodochrous TaxID=1829 RepID=UPI00036451A7|nr:phosphotransferase family protein [Rhodococcus rhodochrous]